jgi:hypothetical protein
MGSLIIETSLYVRYGMDIAALELLARRFRHVLSNEHDALSESEALVRPVCDRRIEGRMPDGDRTGRRDDPANMVGMLIPQLDAEAHVRDVVQVGIGELAKRAVDLAVKIGRRAPMQAAFPA